MSLFLNESISSFCGPSSTLYYNATRDFSKAFYIFACGINVIISILSTLGNILVLCAIRNCESLHPPSKALLFSLAMTDLFVGIAVLPLSIAYYLTIILEMLNYYCVIAVTYVTLSRFLSSVSLFTLVTISIERYMAFRLRLRYRAVVTLKRIVSILVSEWIAAALWSGLRLYSDTAGAISGVVSVLGCCIVAPACYFVIRRGIRSHVTQIRQQQNHGRTAIANNFDLPHYRKTLRNMMWISGLLIACYMPFLMALFATLILGRTHYTHFAAFFSTIAIYLNSSLNPVLYCWRIKDLRDRVMGYCHRTCNCLFHLTRSPTQNTGNTAASIPRPFQLQDPGKEDV
ncbi:PREDICTED: adenosine receptor A3-like [Acropora digitifera]|uniref:adenosine receptor A3-like n=1 Tax=Acropora digitifera TaxID=70779 RepID=UPI00077A2D89|nr:PREDICTED: adenosine receptor A3-like [Acropora digitifera]